MVGLTLAGWQSNNATTNMGVDDSGTVGGSNWSRDLACLDFSEVMVFNDDLDQYFVQSYAAQVGFRFNKLVNRFQWKCI